jgi:hypothetical protein
MGNVEDMLIGMRVLREFVAIGCSEEDGVNVKIKLFIRCGDW